MSETHRAPTAHEVTAFWVLLVLSGLAFVSGVVSGAPQWQALGTGDLGALSLTTLDFIALPLLLGTVLLGIVLAARLHRWGWLVANVLFSPLSTALFAILVLAECRGRRVLARRAVERGETSEA